MPGGTSCCSAQRGQHGHRGNRSCGFTTGGYAMRATSGASPQGGIPCEGKTTPKLYFRHPWGLGQVSWPSLPGKWVRGTAHLYSQKGVVFWPGGVCINVCAPGRTEDDMAQPMHMGRVDACSCMYTPAARGARALLRERMYVHRMVHVIDT